MSYSFSNETKTVLHAIVRHAKKSTPNEAIEELKKLCLCNPDLQKQTHSLSSPNHYPKHLLNSETGEIHMLEHIHQGLGN